MKSGAHAGERQRRRRCFVGQVLSRGGRSGQILEVPADVAPLRFRAPRVDRGFVRALVERAGAGAYLSTGSVYPEYILAFRVAGALRAFLRRHYPDLRVFVRIEPVEGGWRVWTRAEPRELGDQAEVSR
jgi:hypothetical protein